MFESDPQFGEIENFSLEKPRKRDKLDLNLMSQRDLLALYQEIFGLLKGVTLADMDVPKELMIQYRAITKIQAEVAGEEIPTNQKAQVANTCAKLLEGIAKAQGEIYNGQQYKLMERALVKVVKAWPVEEQDKFFAIYAKTLEEVNADDIAE